MSSGGNQQETQQVQSDRMEIESTEATTQRSRRERCNHGCSGGFMNKNCPNRACQNCCRLITPQCCVEHRKQARRALSRHSRTSTRRARTRIQHSDEEDEEDEDGGDLIVTQPIQQQQQPTPLNQVQSQNNVSTQPSRIGENGQNQPLSTNRTTEQGRTQPPTYIYSPSAPRYSPPPSSSWITTAYSTPIGDRTVDMVFPRREPILHNFPENRVIQHVTTNPTSTSPQNRTNVTPQREERIPPKLIESQMHAQNRRLKLSQVSTSAMIEYQIKETKRTTPTPNPVLETQNSTIDEVSPNDQSSNQHQVKLFCQCCKTPTIMKNVLILNSCGHAFCSSCVSRLKRYVEYEDLSGVIKRGTTVSCPSCKLFSGAFTKVYLDIKETTLEYLPK